MSNKNYGGDYKRGDNHPHDHTLSCREGRRGIQKRGDERPFLYINFAFMSEIYYIITCTDSYGSHPNKRNALWLQW